jgi:hypothetical protein
MILQQFIDLLKLENVPTDGGESNYEQWEKNIIRNVSPWPYIQFITSLKSYNLRSVSDFVEGRFIYHVNFENLYHPEFWRSALSVYLDHNEIQPNFLRDPCYYLPMQQITEEYIVAIEKGDESEFWKRNDFMSKDWPQAKFLSIIKSYCLSQDISELDGFLLKTLAQNR